MGVPFALRDVDAAVADVAEASSAALGVVGPVQIVAADDAVLLARTG